MARQLIAEEKRRALHVMMVYGGGISSFVRNMAKAVRNRSITIDVVIFTPVPDAFREAIAQTGGAIYQMERPTKRA